MGLSQATCVLRASGRRFAAQRYLATSTLVPEEVGEHHFEVVVSQAAATDRDRLLADAERFLDSPRLDLSRLFAFPGVERVALVFRCGDQPAFKLPARMCMALGRHGLELEVVEGLQSP